MTNRLYILLELFPNNDWHYGCLSRNPNITWDIVKANPNKPWNYKWLSKNKFNKDPFLIKKNLMCKYFNIWPNQNLRNS